MIGSARVHDKFISLDFNKESRQTLVSSVASVFVASSCEIVSWHCRFGHPNFAYLKCLLPFIFDNKNSISFQREICQLAKHTHTSFPPRPCIPSTPFSLNHGDTWGPSKIKTSNGK